MTDDQTAALEGGWQTEVRRKGDTVRRSSNRWSRSVIDFLDHLEERGFGGSPRKVGSGFDRDGNEMLEFMTGESPHPAPWSDQGIAELGRLLREFHDLARSYQPLVDAVWQDALSRQLGDATLGFGHGDLGPWNIMAVDGLPVGFIDWDTAGPMDPLWEVAHAAWLNVQLHDGDVAELVGLGSLDDRANQFRLFVDAYGLEPADRVGLVDKMVEVAVRDAAAQAQEYSVSPETSTGVAADGYPFAWGLAWRTRAAAWMLKNRRVLEAAIRA